MNVVEMKKEREKMKPKMMADVDDGGCLLNCADRKKNNEGKDKSIVCGFFFLLLFFSPVFPFLLDAVG